MPTASSGTRNLNMVKRENRADMALKSRMTTAPTRLVLRSSRPTKPHALVKSQSCGKIASSSSSSQGNHISLPTRIKLKSLKTSRTHSKDQRATSKSTSKDDVSVPLEADKPDSKLKPSVQTTLTSYYHARDSEDPFTKSKEWDPVTRRTTLRMKKPPAEGDVQQLVEINDSKEDSKFEAGTLLNLSYHGRTRHHKNPTIKFNSGLLNTRRATATEYEQPPTDDILQTQVEPDDSKHNSRLESELQPTPTCRRRTRDLANIKFVQCDTSIIAYDPVSEQIPPPALDVIPTALALKEKHIGLGDFANTIVQLRKGDRDKLHALLEILQKVDEDYEEAPITKKVPTLTTIKAPVVKRKVDSGDWKPLTSPAPKIRDFSSLKARISPKKASTRKNISAASLYPQAHPQDATREFLPPIWIKTLKPIGDVPRQPLYPADLVQQDEPFQKFRPIQSMQTAYAVPAVKPAQPDHKAMDLFRQTVRRVQPFKPVEPVQIVQPFEPIKPIQTNIDLLREAFEEIETVQQVEPVRQVGIVHAVKPSCTQVVKSVQTMQQPVKAPKPYPSSQSIQPAYCQHRANIRNLPPDCGATDLLYYCEDAHGRTAKVVDPTWAKAIVETFSTKYPLTGTLKAAPPATVLLQNPLPSKLQTAEPKVVIVHDAAAIQERLEVLLLQLKENKVQEGLLKGN